jgi:hypothetical protein
MHSIWKAETARPPLTSFRAQQRAFETFRREYQRRWPMTRPPLDTSRHADRIHASSRRQSIPRIFR